MSFIESIEALDQSLFLYLNGLHSPFFDVVMQWISNKYFWIPLYIFLAWLMYRLFNWKLMVLGLVGSGLNVTFSDLISVRIFKEGVERFRPCHNLEIMDLVHTVDGHCGGMYGFISSHATNHFAIAMFIGLFLRPKTRSLLNILLVWAAVIGYSRIYLGVHYPADVLAGSIVGALIGWSIYLVVARTPWYKTALS